MNSERLMNTFLDMVRIDSLSRHEAAMAAHCRAIFEDLGFSVTTDNADQTVGSDTGNLIADLPGTAEGHIVLTAHMDCVAPCNGVRPVVEDGVVRSAGDTILGADDKAGIAAIMEAVRTILESGEARPRITVILTICEELSLLGASALADDLFEGGVPCVVFDADGAPGTIISGAPAHYTFKGVFRGRSAHAGVKPEAGISAIAVAADAVSRMNLGRLDECTTANVGMISGGREVNIVADLCTVDGECRSLKKDRVEAVKEQLTQSMQDAADAAGATVDISWRVDYPAILYTEDHPLMGLLAGAARNAGLEPCFKTSGGGADANVFGTKGLAPVTVGIGMTNFHTTDEFIKVEDLEGTARFATEIIRASVQ